MNLAYHYALSATVSIAYKQTYTMFVDDAFVGSSTIREEVGTAFSKMIVQKTDVRTTLEETMNTIGPKYWEK